MVGSSQSIAQCNFTLNTIVAEELCQFADRLEKAANLSDEISAIILDVIKNHKRVIFNGNGYCDDWIAEAERRGLPNIRNTVDAIAAIRAEKNLALMEKHAVLSRIEMDSRCEILYENYSKIIHIEALTMVEMAKRQILPAAIRYKSDLAQAIANITAAQGDIQVEREMLDELSFILLSFKKDLGQLETAIEAASALHDDTVKQAEAYRDQVFTAMGLLRQDSDNMEVLIGSKDWPLPSYSDMLFNV